MVSSQAYLPFGAARQSMGTLPTKRGFTGQYADESGLSYFGARYYDSYLGRWIQPDTIVPEAGNPQDLNRYSFVRNNPIRYIDPSGHLTQEQIEQWVPDWNKLSPEVLEMLRGLVFSDQLSSMKTGSDGYSSSVDKYTGQAILDESGHLAFQRSEGGSFTAAEFSNELTGGGISDYTLYRTTDRGFSTVYQDGKYFNGWGPVIEGSTVKTTMLGRGIVVYGGTTVASAVGTGIFGCAVGAVAGGAGCAVAAGPSAVIGGVVGLAVSITTDGITSNPGTMVGDITYSYRFANGHAINVMTRDGRVQTIGNKYINNEFEAVLWGIGVR